MKRAFMLLAVTIAVVAALVATTAIGGACEPTSQTGPCYAPQADQ